MAKEGYREIYVRLPARLKAWLEDFAERVGVPQRTIVIDALEEYRDKHDPQDMRPRGK